MHRTKSEAEQGLGVKRISGAEQESGVERKPGMEQEPGVERKSSMEQEPGVVRKPGLKQKPGAEQKLSAQEAAGAAASSGTPALSFRDVTFSYEPGAEPVISRLSAEIQKGEFVSLIGPSGCGKSTLFRMVNQLLPVTSGEILVDGLPIRGRKHYCGYMPQQDLLFPWRTVAENVRLPLEIRGGFSRQEMQSMALDALKTVGLEGWGDKSPRELSGGMRQRAAFARTLLTGSDLLLLDEPFSALDYLTRLTLREWLLNQWENDHKTILFITHDVEEAVFLSTRILAVEGTPITGLRSVPVVLPYPRTEDTMALPEAVALKEELIHLLRRQKT